MIRFVHRTCSWRFINKDLFVQAIESGRPIIVCFWHQRLCMMTMTKLVFKDPPYMLLSSHSDGQLIGKIIKRFGFQVIEGSSKRGGAEAALGIIRILKKGGVVGITPDGPKGPNRQASLGVAQLAYLSKAMVIPLSYSVKRHRLLKSWDTFMLPLPFSQGVFYAGKPIDAGHFGSASDLLVEIQEALDSTTDLSDTVL